MEGYSVTEAASILGVPTERVWELLARGVLAGAAEGETGMRVYLQPRPAPAPPAADAGRPNGDASPREPEREQPVDRVPHVLGVEGMAQVVLHALAELHADLCPVLGHLPALDERALPD